MKAYVAHAELYCEDCARDFDDFDPDRLYADGGGEADTPHHCANGGQCVNVIEPGDLQDVAGEDSLAVPIGAPLRNPLTDAGVQYVRESYVQAREVPTASHQRAVSALWRDTYPEAFREPEFTRFIINAGDGIRFDVAEALAHVDAGHLYDFAHSIRALDAPHTMGLADELADLLFSVYRCKPEATEF